MFLKNNYSEGKSLTELSDIISEYCNVSTLRRILKNKDFRKLSKINKDDLSRSAARMVYNDYISQRGGGTGNVLGRDVSLAIQELFEKKAEEKAKKLAAKELKRKPAEDSEGSDLENRVQVFYI